MMRPAPILVFGWGNPSRGDDALGPLFVQRLRTMVDQARVECLDDFQLQVEHALDLVGRERVLFVDASVSCAAPFEVTNLKGARDASFSTHALSPDALIHVFADLHGVESPPCTLLAIRAERFELGEPPSQNALSNLASALTWGVRWIG
jgi:hydrogenase maturation protease